MNKAALDTNIIIFSHGSDVPGKQVIARRLLNSAPVISSQVISEYLNVMRRLFKMNKMDLMNICSRWLENCHVQPVVFSTIDHARRLINKYDFQMFDGIVVASALEAKCDILYSEDMQHEQVVDGTLKILNPFL
jgi:predicted nucleic acid-binding protein